MIFDWYTASRSIVYSFTVLDNWRFKLSLVWYTWKLGLKVLYCGMGLMACFCINFNLVNYNVTVTYICCLCNIYLIFFFAKERYSESAIAWMEMPTTIAVSINTEGMGSVYIVFSGRFWLCIGIAELYLYAIVTNIIIEEFENIANDIILRK